MPDKKKGPSLARAARNYKKAYTKPKSESVGSHYFNDGASPYAIGTTERKMKYKPKPRAGTYGGSVDGKPATKRVRRNKGL
jgi:hypothetical protein